MKKTERNNGSQLTRLIAGALFTAILATTAATTAAASPFVDYDAKGSITVTYRDEKGKGVEGAELKLIKVGSAVDDGGNAVFVAEDAFSEYEKELNGVTEAGEGEASLAAKIADIAESQSVPGTTVKTDSDGKANWKDLDLGIYVVINTSGAKGYLTIDPFLITVPRLLDGEYVYDVDADPKPTYVEKVTTTTTKTPPPPRVPQTGQLWWPVPILLCAGILFIVLGGVFRKNE